MTTVVLLVLAIVWGAVLFSWLRSRAQSTFSDSVGTFRRHLTILERTTPATVPAANRRRSGPIAGRGPSSARPVGPASRPASTRLAARPGMPGPDVPDPAMLQPAMSGPAMSQPAMLQPALRRRQSQKRRRDVLAVLVAAAVAILVAAAVTANKDVVILQLLCDVSLGAYVSLLVRQRNLAGEREFKLSYLDDAAAPRRPPVGQRPTRPAPASPARPAAARPARPAAARPAAARPARPAAARPARIPRPAARPARVGYEVAAGYGEMALRRAAN